MVGNFDYNNDEVMNILNNPNFTEEQKKALFERYKAELKDKRRKEIVNRLNECAKQNPIITQEEYIEFLKGYSNDDLSKPFEIIEKELNMFNKKMRDKYDAYLKDQAAKAAREQVKLQESVVETPKEEPASIEDINLDEEITPDVTPINFKPSDNTNSSNPIELDQYKEVMPEEIKEDLNEKGSASAIIVSIIAIIIGMVIMYSIIKLK